MHQITYFTLSKNCKIYKEKQKHAKNRIPLLPFQFNTDQMVKKIRYEKMKIITEIKGIMKLLCTTLKKKQDDVANFPGKHNQPKFSPAD